MKKGFVSFSCLCGMDVKEFHIFIDVPFGKKNLQFFILKDEVIAELERLEIKSVRCDINVKGFRPVIFLP